MAADDSYFNKAIQVGQPYVTPPPRTPQMLAQLNTPWGEILPDGTATFKVRLPLDDVLYLSKRRFRVAVGPKFSDAVSQFLAEKMYELRIVDEEASKVQDYPESGKVQNLQHISEQMMGAVKEMMKGGGDEGEGGNNPPASGQ